MTAISAIPVLLQIGADTRPVEVGRILAETSGDLQALIPDLLREVADAFEESE